jgi:hypothetical protein
VAFGSYNEEQFLQTHSHNIDTYIPKIFFVNLMENIVEETDTHQLLMWSKPHAKRRVGLMNGVM